MSTLWFDTETYSEADLKLVGARAYAEHPSTEVIVAQWALDDGEPLVCDCTGRRWPPHLIALLEDSSITVVAHGSFFDRNILRECWGVDVPVERWQDTLAQGLAHGLPGGLGAIGAVLGVADDEAKDARGKRLIQLFCKPAPKGHKLRRATRETHPAEWQEFLGYSRQDIISMRAIAKRMPQWNYPNNPVELASWRLDQKINDRGFAVDLDLANGAVVAAAREKKRNKRTAVEATGGAVASVSQRDALLAHILAEHGVALPDLRADTLRRRADDPSLPEAVRLLINLRLEDSKASVSKFTTLLRSVCADGRLRGTMQWCGAARTGRWAHRMFQPGNMKRPDLPQADIDDGIAAIKAGVADLVCDDVMNVCANAVRGSIIAPPRRKLVVADLANIEGRGVAALAGEKWKLQAYADYDAGRGPDLYKLAYARSFNVDPETATGKRRQIGKVQELMLGYQGGVGAYLTGAATHGIDLSELADAVFESAPLEALEAAAGFRDWAVDNGLPMYGLEPRVYIACECLKAQWRANHPATVALWGAIEEGFRLAVDQPGHTFLVGEHLKMRVDGAWLRVRLPSGRYLCYLRPRVAPNGNLSFLGVNPYTRKWGPLHTYGGKLTENVTQAWARDVMAHNMPAIEDAKYAVLLSVHDEVVTETPDTPEFSAAKLSAILAKPIPWAAGVPLAAAGFETYRYRKG